MWNSFLDLLTPVLFHLSESSSFKLKLYMSYNVSYLFKLNDKLIFNIETSKEKRRGKHRYGNRTCDLPAKKNNKWISGFRIYCLLTAKHTFLQVFRCCPLIYNKCWHNGRVTQALNFSSGVIGHCITDSWLILPHPPLCSAVQWWALLTSAADL